MSKPVILTGLRANNDLHIGNYLGALLPLVDMAKSKAGEYQINLFVPDLHSFTTPIDHSSLQQSIMQSLRIFIAAGLPIERDDVFVYRQSYIPAHSELAWILECFTSFGEMSRMTQFKDKSKGAVRDLLAKVEEEAGQDNEVDKQIDGMLKQFDEISDKYKDIPSVQKDIVKVILTALENLKETIDEQIEDKTKLRDMLRESVAFSSASVGLFNYPVLMAADILLYGAEYIPVGDDQTQHLEYARDISEKMNKQFGEIFIVPKSAKEQHAFFGKEQGLRIRDLQTPVKKMSKSDESSKGILFLTDKPEDARKKIMSAETDSFGEIQYDYTERPGVSNLLDLYEHFGGNKNEFIGQFSYGPLKTAVADKACKFLEDFQKKLALVDDEKIMHKLEASEMLMHEVSSQRLHKVQQAVGLRPQ